MVKNKQSMLNDIADHLVVQDYNKLRVQKVVKELFRLNLKIMLDIELVNYVHD